MRHCLKVKGVGGRRGGGGGVSQILLLDYVVARFIKIPPFTVFLFLNSFQVTLDVPPSSVTLH